MAGRAAETITLQPIDPGILGHLELQGIFNALADHLGTEATDLGAQFGHHPLGKAEVPGMPDQAAIQLDQIGRQCLQAIKAGAMPAEIVDRHPIATLPIGRNRSLEASLLAKSVIRKLQHDALGRQPASGQDGLCLLYTSRCV